MTRSLYRWWAVVTVVLLAALSLSGPAIAQTEVGDPQRPSVMVHVVQPGETAEDIAATYGTTVAVLRVFNALDSSADIHAGERLLIPGAGGHIPGLTTVTAQLSDSLYSIARQRETSVEQLGYLNQIVNPYLLYAGQHVIVLGDQPDRNWQAQSGSLIEVAVRTNQNPYALAARNGRADPLVSPRVLAVRVEAAPQNVADDVSLAVDQLQGIDLEPVPLERGRTGYLTIRTGPAGSVTGTFMGELLTFFAEDGISHAFIGVNRWTAPGLYPLELSVLDAAGHESYFHQLVMVGAGGYDSESIRLPEDVAAVLNDQVAVQQEYTFIQQSMTGFNPERYWSGLFLLPAPGLMSSAFGIARSYNGGPYDSFHSGADFSAKTGTPITAPAPGIVVDTGFLNVRGFVTIIDHGWGVYTGYWHQSAVMVEPGDFVNAGQTIGSVGSTGLSTASHLHWEMWVSGVQVDPLQWVRQSFN